MKKILLIVVSVLSGSALFAQTTTSAPGSMDVPANKIKPATTKPETVKPVVKTTVKPVALPEELDKNSSLYTGDKIVAAKPVVDNGGSVAPVEAIKAVVKPVDNSGSVSDEMQKPVIKTQEPKADKTIEPARQVKEVLPAILKGSSIDPDARPVMPAVKTPDAVVPAQNSGNTQPAAEQKQVSKENNPVPSSTVPVKKD